MRGFIDDCYWNGPVATLERSLNPRSCAASSMTRVHPLDIPLWDMSQSAFVRGFIDDEQLRVADALLVDVSIRVRARLHR